jgi:hypothetical protein
MGQLLHGSARTTAVVRKAIQQSQETSKALAKRYDINPKTVMKWRQRDFVHDKQMGPKKPRSIALTPEEEAVCLLFRKHTLLPLDDCLYSLQETIPHLSRSSLHRLFQRHGISRLPDVGDKKPARKKFKSYPIGYFHIDIAEVYTEEGRQYMFVAIDRTTKFAYAELHDRATRRSAASFLKSVIKIVPYKIHTVLTDNGIQFTDTKGECWTTKEIRHFMETGQLFVCGSFDLVCAKENIDHRLTKPAHPWTNGQVERMNRTIKEATVKRYHYQSHEQLKEHLYTFLMAYNFAKRLKTLKGLTPYEEIIKCWQNEPERFKINPLHHKLGLYTYVVNGFHGRSA